MAGQERDKGIAVGLLQHDAGAALRCRLDHAHRRVAADVAEILVRGRFRQLGIDDADRDAVLERGVRIILRVRFVDREIIRQRVRVVIERLALRIALGEGIHGADEILVDARLELLQRHGLKARRLAELLIGIIRAELRPVVIRAEIDVFVRMVAQARIGVHRHDCVVHCVIAALDHGLLAVDPRVHTLRGIELAAVRRHERDRAHAVSHGLRQRIDRGRIAVDDAVICRRDLHGARSDHDHVSGPAGIFLRRLVQLGRRILLRLRGLLAAGRLLLRGLDIVFRIVRRLLRYLLRLLNIRLRRRLLRLRQRGVKTFAALLGSGAAAYDQHGVLLRAGVIIEFIERFSRRQKRVAHRKMIGIIRLQRRKIASVKERRKGELRPLRKLLAVHTRDRLPVSEQRPDADTQHQRQQRAKQRIIKLFQSGHLLRNGNTGMR